MKAKTSYKRIENEHYTYVFENYRQIINKCLNITEASITDCYNIVQIIGMLIGSFIFKFMIYNLTFRRFIRIFLWSC